MASEFIVKDLYNPQSKTFYHEEKLPPLPIPTVDQTIKKYLDSCQALLNEEDLKKTTAICNKFLEKDSKILQEKLLKHASAHRNWLEDWWLKKGYLETRVPMPLQNFSGPATYLESFWPLKEGSQLERAALGTYVYMLFWDALRKEKVTQHVSDGKVLSMRQLRFLFNTCRVPQRGQDFIKHCFSTEAEGGHSPTHIIVLCRGYIFKIDAVDPKTGKLITPPQYYSIYKQVRKICEKKKVPGPGVSALTCLNRDEWADLRQHLCLINVKNQQVLEDIESSICVQGLEECSPLNYSEMSYEGLAGDPNLRWYDKSYCNVTTMNGGIICNCDHSPYDAMALIWLVEFMTYQLQQINGVWPGQLESNDFPQPEELKFDLDSRILDSIEKAKQELYAIRNNIDVVQPVFTKFGKAALKEVKVHPDFMVQFCLQLAYMDIHGKPAPAYETATTRQFYHGRTETCRTCTPEVIEACRALLNNPAYGSTEYMQLSSLIRKALKKFVALMKDCASGKGCDRHLMGLLLICIENGFDIPDIYTDKAFAATGGNGNFILSTSCLGYLKGQGSLVPMLENGYGVFYRINDHKIVYSISAYNSCSETSSQRLSDHFQYHMTNVFEIFKKESTTSKF